MAHSDREPIRVRSKRTRLKTSLKQRHVEEILLRQIQPILLILDNLEDKYQKVQLEYGRNPRHWPADRLWLKMQLELSVINLTVASFFAGELSDGH